MSILNNANRGSHIPCLFLLDKRINEFSLKKPESWLLVKDLLENCTPEEMFYSDDKDEQGEFKFEKNPASKLRETFSFWSEQGLWQLSEKDEVKAWSVFSVSESLEHRLFRLIGSKEYDLFSGNDIEPFIRAVCVYLALPQHTFVGREFLSNSNVAIVMQSHMLDRASETDVRLTLNDSERKGFFDYGLMLGFLEKVSSGVYVVDPTRAIEMLLGQVFSKEEQKLTISEFIRKINELFPVFDNGRYRLQCEQLMSERNKHWVTHADYQISASLSIALYRLNLSGKIYLDLGSDSIDRLDLILPGNQTKAVSHVRIAGEHL